jgi:catalase
LVQLKEEGPNMIKIINNTPSYFLQRATQFSRMKREKKREKKTPHWNSNVYGTKERASP